jgi:dihydroorotate dehydrogenase
MDETCVEAMGMCLAGRVGVAAGLDRYGEFAHRAGRLGLGFVETGTVTPRPEPGRNRGIHILIANLLHHGWHRRPFRARRCALGISIARNSSTSLADAARDYHFCLEKGWNFADYFTLNLGSVLIEARETPHILPALLAEVREQQLLLAARTGRYVPIAVKAVLRNDTFEELARLAGALSALGLDGILAATPDPEPGRIASSPGALIRELAHSAGTGLTIISVGGVRCAAEARARIQAGASLLQLHRGLVEHGPELASYLNHVLCAHRGAQRSPALPPAWERV